jgi:hypothetical protein
VVIPRERPSHRNRMGNPSLLYRDKILPTNGSTTKTVRWAAMGLTRDVSSYPASEAGLGERRAWEEFRGSDDEEETASFVN